MRLHAKEADQSYRRNIYNSTSDQNLPWVAETPRKIIVARLAINHHLTDVLETYRLIWSLKQFIEHYGLRNIWYDYWLRHGPRLLKVPYLDAFELLDKTAHTAIRPSMEQISKALRKLPHGKTGTMPWIAGVTNIPRVTLYKIRQGRDVKLPVGRFVALAVTLEFPIQILEKSGDPADLL